MATSTLASPSVYDFGMSFRNTESSPSIPVQATSTLPSMAERQRPKLFLNTTSVGPKRSLGRGNTGLRLDTFGDASPTTRNTTHNTLGMPQDSSADRFKTKPRKPLFPRLDTSNLSPSSSPRTPSPQAFKPAANPQDSTTNSPTTTPSASKPTSRSPSPTAPSSAPYSLDSTTRSILRNTPLQKRSRPPPTPSSPAAPTDPTTNKQPQQPPPQESQTPTALTSPTPRSPSTKKLRFRDPLEEEVQTNTYLMRHSDLRSRSVSPATPEAGGLGGSLSMTPLSSSSTGGRSGPNALTASGATIAGGLITVGSRAGQPTPRAREVAPTPASSRAGVDERASSSAQSHAIPKTPIAGRNAKDRDWRWTLGPLPGLAVEGSALPGQGTGSQTSSDDEDLEASLGETVAASRGYHVSTPQGEDGEEDEI